MGTKSGSNPDTVLTFFVCWLVLLLLGFFKVAFSTLATASSEVNKKGTPMISKLNSSNCFAASIFDSMHAIGVGIVAGLTVP